MAGSNDFLPFSNAAGANVVTQATYLADPATPVGFSSGVAPSIKLNKVWRQSSLMAAAIGQLIADVGLNAVDDGVMVTLEKQMALAFDLARYALDTGPANANIVSYTPAVLALVDGMVLRYKAASANTGPTTLNVNGLGNAPLVGFTHSPLNGGEMVVNSDVWVQYNSSLAAWVLMESTGGNQISGRLIGIRIISTTGTYTPTTGTQSVVVEVQGGGGAGAGAPGTSASTTSIGSGGNEGSYARGRFTSGFSGLAITIGAGGTAVNSGGGGAGGATSFGGLMSSPGGGGGLTAGPSVPPYAIQGSSANSAPTGGFLNITGSAGGVATSAVGASSGGYGAPSRFGQGGTISAQNANGVTASGFGSGGGGSTFCNNCTKLSALA